MQGRTLLSRWGPMLLAVAAIVVIWQLPEVETLRAETGLTPVEAYRAQVVDPLPGPTDPEEESR